MLLHPATLLIRENKMKTQESYDYKVLEDVQKTDNAGQLVAITTKRTISSGSVNAFNEDNARVKAQHETKFPDDCVIDNVEIRVRPFCPK